MRNLETGFVDRIAENRVVVWFMEKIFRVKTVSPGFYRRVREKRIAFWSKEFPKDKIRKTTLLSTWTNGPIWIQTPGTTLALKNGKLINCISHETLHQILYKLEGWDATKSLDNLKERHGVGL